MSPVALRLPAKTIPLIGATTVLRALPRRELRLVGPFVLLDHAGPSPGGSTVPWHPHAGLSTLSYLLDGEIHHLDSLGTTQILRPGDINLMTAGRGIAHSEIASESRLHLLQLWLALPPPERSKPPLFQHVPSAQLPFAQHGAIQLTRLIGDGTNQLGPSPVRFPWSTTCIRVSSHGHGSVVVDVPSQHQLAVYCIQGQAQLGSTALEASVLYALKESTTIDIECAGPTELLVLGGERFEPTPVIFDNFVAGTLAEARALLDDWQSHQGKTLLGLPALPNNSATP